MKWVLQDPVMILGNVPALIIGVVPNVLDVKLDGHNLIVLNVSLVTQGTIVNNVTLIRAIVDIPTAQVI